jgi:ankyrin repeat protein
MQERNLPKCRKATVKPGIAANKPKTEGIMPDKERLESLNMRLLEFAKKGKIENAKRLLDAGADVNIRNSDGRTPLMLAAYTGYTGMCKLLFEHKADVNAIDNYDMTALMLATAGGRDGTAEFLRAHRNKEAG